MNRKIILTLFALCTVEQTEASYRYNSVGLTPENSLHMILAPTLALAPKIYEMNLTPQYRMYAEEEARVKGEPLPSLETTDYVLKGLRGVCTLTYPGLLALVYNMTIHPEKLLPSKKELAVCTGITAGIVALAWYHDANNRRKLRAQLEALTQAQQNVNALIIALPHNNPDEGIGE